MQGQAQKDLQWEAYFANPGGYYDNRENKRNPKAPDFKSKDGCARVHSLQIESSSVSVCTSMLASWAYGMSMSVSSAMGTFATELQSLRLLLSLLVQLLDAGLRWLQV